MADGQAAGGAAPDGGNGGGNAKTPSDFLKSIKGKPVVVKLNSGVDYRGGRSMHEVYCSCHAQCDFVPSAMKFKHVSRSAQGGISVVWEAACLRLL